MSPGRSSLPALAALAAAFVLRPDAAVQPAVQKDTCPWCRGDPALMEAAGTLSHGPFAIGPGTTAELAARSPSAAWVFLETAHLRWAFALGPAAVDAGERQRVDAELDRLRAALPAVPQKPRKLDPWLRLHLLAMKGEELYARFQDLLGVRDEDFPSGDASAGSARASPFMGIGPYLGEKERFEVVVHATRAGHQLFTEQFTGVRATDSLRWHFSPLHKLLASVPAEDPDLKRDRWLWPHVAHNLSHLFLCAYKHFSYDPPIWLDEGLAVALEKEIEPASNTTDGEEGSMRERSGPDDWEAAVRRLLSRGEERTLAQLWKIKDFGEMDLPSSLCAWSRLRFLLDLHPRELARFLAGVKGQVDASGRPSGADLPGLQRRLLLELWGWTPADLDAAWKAWASGPR